MANAPKSDRKKLVGTTVVGNTTIVWTRMDTEAEFARLDVSAIPGLEGPAVGGAALACLVYGVKQIVADVGAGLEGEGRFNAMVLAIASLKAGVWPRREAAAIDPGAAIAVMAKTLGRTIPEIRAMLGLA